MFFNKKYLLVRQFAMNIYNQLMDDKRLLNFTRIEPKWSPVWVYRRKLDFFLKIATKKVQSEPIRLFVLFCTVDATIERRMSDLVSDHNLTVIWQYFVQISTY